uniref:15-cis-phytoene synthase n=1 Tax=Timema tahoe TaxID=61484 RepID=A0A7R9FF35_9NEOP|nr:unnamed protein product [Timema tahoe]
MIRPNTPRIRTVLLVLALFPQILPRTGQAAQSQNGVAGSSPIHRRKHSEWSKQVMKHVFTEHRRTNEFLGAFPKNQQLFDSVRCVFSDRQFDHENFLCTLLLPHDCRTSAFAIRAFNIEVARVQDQISDPRIGQMRLKFWEDIIESIFKNKAHKHPVALELHRASKKHKLSKRYLKRLITARSNQLNISGFPDLEAMEVYSEGSVSSVYYLLLETAGVENVHADHAASHLGKAQGISNILRSVFHNIQHSVVALPQDVLLKHSVSHETVLRAECNKALMEVFFDIANRAKQHLAKIMYSSPMASLVLTDSSQLTSDSQK